jgi:hypothetical protein
MKSVKCLKALWIGMLASSLMTSLVWAGDFETPPTQQQTPPALSELQSRVCNSVHDLIAKKILTSTQDGQTDLVTICNLSSDSVKLGEAAGRVYEGMSQIYNDTNTSPKTDRPIFSAMNDDEALANAVYGATNSSAAQ